MKSRKPRRAKKPSPPKVRHAWKIRPETRVKASGKIYRRSAQKKKTWVDDVSWFGEEL